MHYKKLNFSQNDKTVLVNIVGTFLVKGLSLLLSLFSMPAYIRFFNDDTTLGLWFTVLSVLNWILYFDLGIGNGLRNYLSETYAKKDTEASKRYISSAYVAVGVLCLSLAIVFLAVFRFINWNRVFNISVFSVSKSALHTTVLIVFLGILLQLFFKLISSVIYAIQKSAINNFLGLITSLIIVLSLYILPSGTNDDNLVVMAFIHLTAVSLPQLIATIIIFSRKKYRGMTPSLRYFDLSYAKSVLSLGGFFLYVQIVYMLIMSTNEYMITALVGSEPVVEYQVYYRLFTLVGTLFTLAMTPIWSSVTKALAEHNYKWVNGLYKKALALGALCIAGNFAVIPFSQFAVNLWLGEQTISINYSYAFSFAILGSIMILNSVLSTFANGAGELKTQAIFFSIGAAVKFPIAWWLISRFDSWIMVIWANCISMLLYCIVQPIWLKKDLNRIQQKNEIQNTV